MRKFALRLAWFVIQKLDGKRFAHIRELEREAIMRGIEAVNPTRTPLFAGAGELAKHNKSDWICDPVK